MAKKKATSITEMTPADLRSHVSDALAGPIEDFVRAATAKTADAVRQLWQDDRAFMQAKHDETCAAYEAKLIELAEKLATSKERETQARTEAANLKRILNTIKGQVEAKAS